MVSFLHSRTTYYVLAGGVIIVIVAMMLGVGRNNGPELVTTIVETGTVRQMVSVSGVAEAEQTAALTFPISGIVRSINVDEGDEVAAGDILIELERDALLADRQDAIAALNSARANRDELLAGPTGTARDATTESVTVKQETLTRTRESERQKVANARATLLSTDLTAVTDDPNEEAVPPTITGTYTCDSEGVYTIDVFLSAAASDYSYRLSGLESNTEPVSVTQPLPLGECGLRIQFDPDSNYSRTVWEVEIPNTKSSQFITNRNAYALALTQASSAIALAERDLALTQANATDTNAPPRNEAVARADAAIEQARARVNRIDATIADRVLRAPFAGTITNVDVRPGETVATAPVVTLLAASDFEVTARIPEIDIGKLALGQPVEMIFDARSGEVLTGTIDFISLKATEIDGVAYYEAMVEIPEPPAWLRSGLNADIDIIILEEPNSLRIPKRFVIEATDGSTSVLRLENGVQATTTIKVQLAGNDGFMAITGLAEGDTLVAP